MDDKKTNNKSLAEKQTGSIHRLGRISGLLCIISMLSVPFVITLYYRISVDLSGFGAAIIALSPFFVIGVVEVISYGPVLGPGATYLAFITGNVSNMKLPAAVSGMSIAGVEPGTLKGRTVSTLAVGISSLVTTLVIFLGMLFLRHLLPLLQSPLLMPAFDNMIYALMGAFVTPIVTKNLKGTSIPFAVMAVVIFSKVKINHAFLMPLMVATAIIWCYYLHRAEAKKPPKQTFDKGA